MGTFHADKGELHGITVVVRTNGERVWVGRCDTEGPDGIVLLDADCHDEGQDGRTNEAYLERAAKFGVFKQHDRVIVPRADIASVERLGSLR
jgi:hypothetical protein